MINFAWMMGFIGVAVGLMVGIFVFSAVEDGMDCPDVATNPDGNEACQKATSIAWAVIGILPITLFMALFTIFGGMKGMEFA